MRERGETGAGMGAEALRENAGLERFTVDVKDLKDAART